MDNKTSGSRKPFLKPASFKSVQSEQNGSSSENGSASSSFVNNPFLKCEKEEQEATKQDEKNNEHEKDPAKESNNLFKPANTNLFANVTGLSENSNFIFGQNLHERVVMENVNTASTETSEENVKKSDETHLFSSALTSSQTPPEKDNSNEENREHPEGLTQPAPDEGESQKKESTESISSDNNMSLVEAARKYEEMRCAQKRKYDEVETTTGEEDERNILEISCKLFTFIENNYEERGRGILRLNDSKTSSSSRVVFRASGSLRLLLNTKVWRDQICEQPSQKSLRLTAFDTNGIIKIYLAMGRVEDMAHLYRALSSRIRKEKERSPEPLVESKSLETIAVTADENTDEPAKKRSATIE